MEKNSLALFCDAHFHLIPSQEALGGLAFLQSNAFAARSVTASHSIDEFLAQEKKVLELKKKDCRVKPDNDAEVKPDNDTDGKPCDGADVKPDNDAGKKPCDGADGKSNAPLLLQSFGLHPQAPFLDERDFKVRLDFLEGLLSEKRIAAIGECGYDLFTKEFSDNITAQEKAFFAQIELASRFGFPIIVHARKAMEKIFFSAAKLKKIPAVIFHSFSGTESDALSILGKGINAYFSFGKPLLNGAKKAVRCVKTLPLDRLLFETDAPYQTLKGELATSPAEIAEVYQAAFELRAAGTPFEARPLFAEFCAQVARNFRRAFALASARILR